MNVDRMRKQNEQKLAAFTESERLAARERRFAAMTPEHRAKHVGPFADTACTTCITIAAGGIGDALRKMQRAVNESRRPGVSLAR